MYTSCWHPLFPPHVILAIPSTFCVGEGCLVFWGLVVFLSEERVYYTLATGLSVEGEYAQ